MSKGALETLSELQDGALKELESRVSRLRSQETKTRLSVSKIKSELEQVGAELVEKNKELANLKDKIKTKNDAAEIYRKEQVAIIEKIGDKAQEREDSAVKAEQKAYKQEQDASRALSDYNDQVGHVVVDGGTLKKTIDQAVTKVIESLTPKG